MHFGRIIAFLTLPATVFSAEKTITETPLAPAEDSIAAARRDLETIKAARGPVEQSRADLPQFSTPEFQISAPTSSRPTGKISPAEAAATKKSANWLVDAMIRKPARALDEKGRVIEKSRNDDEETSPTGVSNTSSEENRLSDKPERRETHAPAELVVNPLANFMAGWMSPQDYKLLQPGMGAESAANLVARGESSPVAIATPGIEGGALAKAVPVRSSQPPRDNPFLQEFVAPAPSNTGTVGAAPAPIAPLAAKPVVALPEAPPQKAGTPAFVKPNDDAKYFKPLKRF